MFMHSTGVLNHSVVPFWVPLCTTAAVFRVPVPFCEGLRRAHDGLFAGSYPGPSHQCGDAKHHVFSWPRPWRCHREHVAGVCSPLPPESRLSPCSCLSGSPSMAASAEPVSAPASLHPCYSRDSFFFSFPLFFSLCTHHVRVCEGCILENKFIH